MKNPLINLENISFTYNSENNHVLRTLSLEIQKGEITAILGPNGIGKTTLLHLILGWIKADNGYIYLDGKKQGNYTRREMGRLLGLVPQDEHITFEYSLLEYVLLGRTPHLHSLESPGEKDYEAAITALKKVGLENLSDRPVTHLSGGEKQLVLVARSLAQEPKILLLDEPMSNLDLGNKLRLIEVLRSLKKEGVTILFTSHEPEVAASLSSYLILMGNDNNIEHGTTEKILTSESLSRIYGVRVRIADYEGKKIVIWH
ncbi:MAG: ABC transporter ATP-binding protein [Spirochaetia bacterium]|jgi:iron complex transport system ATP-binding protein|nr:ABC transporter ATP-binding protein [Spirochaetia bacterium]